MDGFDQEDRELARSELRQTFVEFSNAHGRDSTPVSLCAHAGRPLLAAVPPATLISKSFLSTSMTPDETPKQTPLNRYNSAMADANEQFVRVVEQAHAVYRVRAANALSDFQRYQNAPIRGD